MKKPEETLHFYFKLKNDIPKDEEVELAKAELETLLGRPVDPILNFVDVMVKEPLRHFLNNENRVQDLVLRLPHPGTFQGFQVTMPLRDFSKLFYSLAYFKEVYVAGKIESHKVADALRIMNVNGVVEQDCTFVLTANLGETIYAFYRLVPFPAMLDYTHAITKRWEAEDAPRKFQQLLKHLNSGFHRIYRLSGLGRDIEDLMDAGDVNSKYLLHDVHDFHGSQYPRMVRALINMLNMNEDDVLLDPFNGGGTMTLEAILMGYDAIGNEINPLFDKIASIKCDGFQKIDVDEFSGIIETITKNIGKDLRKWRKSPSKEQPTLLKFEGSGESEANASLYDMIMKLENFMDKDSVREIAIIKRHIDLIKDSSIRGLCEVILSDCIFRQQKIRRPQKLFKHFKRGLYFNYKRLYVFHKILKPRYNLQLGQYTGILGDARKLQVSSDSIGGIVTSPPYLDAERYSLNTYASLFCLGLINNGLLEQLREDIIGHQPEGEFSLEILEKSEIIPPLGKNEIKRLYEDLSSIVRSKAHLAYHYYLDMYRSLKEVHRVLKAGRRCILLSAEPHFWIVDGRVVTFPNSKILTELAKKVGFREERSLWIPLAKRYKRHKVKVGEYLAFLKK